MTRNENLGISLFLTIKTGKILLQRKKKLITSIVNYDSHFSLKMPPNEGRTGEWRDNIMRVEENILKVFLRAK